MKPVSEVNYFLKPVLGSQFILKPVLEVNNFRKPVSKVAIFKANTSLEKIPGDSTRLKLKKFCSEISLCFDKI